MARARRKLFKLVGGTPKAKGPFVVEVLLRCVDGYRYLVPTPTTNKTIVGCLARAQLKHPVDVIEVGHMSNHVHLVLRVGSVKRLSKFMGHFAGNSARKVNRLLGRSGPMWNRRYSHAQILDEVAERARAAYLWAQGTKERGVSHPRCWPGTQSAKQRLNGKGALRGVWHNLTLGRKQPMTVELALWTFMEGWSQPKIKRFVRRVCREIARIAAAASPAVQGPQAAMSQDPFSKPAGPFVRRPNPRFHASDPAVAQAYRLALRSM